MQDTAFLFICSLRIGQYDGDDWGFATEQAFDDLQQYCPDEYALEFAE